ncbi:hypothetical protein DAEQUDRAFT_728751 [Daedalea quercina L-15889]|uniref:Uncharacterized protein n=1 Tax=Daedalea quercina L-15889 TaxID=1314783 RepID=A0A165P4J6_9APHY|nr:hypothetical protein DAEQUDRAFT_728751 [Daedalea quercina L-15889]
MRRARDQFQVPLCDTLFLTVLSRARGMKYKAERQFHRPAGRHRTHDNRACAHLIGALVYRQRAQLFSGPGSILSWPVDSPVVLKLSPGPSVTRAGLL